MLGRPQRTQAAEAVQHHTAAPPDPSGADTDARLVGLWLHGKSTATQEAYGSDLAKFLDFIEGKPLRAVTLADVQEFSDFISELLAPASQARVLAALKSLFAFGHQVGYLPFDVGRPVKLPARRGDRAERILPADDVHSMIAHAKKGRDRALIRTLYIGGLRVTEAVALKSRDLVACEEVDKGQIGVFGKGSKPGPCSYPRASSRSSLPWPWPIRTRRCSAPRRRIPTEDRGPSPPDRPRGSSRTPHAVLA